MAKILLVLVVLLLAAAPVAAVEWQEAPAVAPWALLLESTLSSKGYFIELIIAETQGDGTYVRGLTLLRERAPLHGEPPWEDRFEVVCEAEGKPSGFPVIELSKFSFGEFFDLVGWVEDNASLCIVLSQ